MQGLTHKLERGTFHIRRLTTLAMDPKAFRTDRETVRLAAEAENIEARPIWKPMYLQPEFAGCECVEGAVAEDLFDKGLCLPSGSSLVETDLERICGIVRDSCLGV